MKARQLLDTHWMFEPQRGRPKRFDVETMGAQKHCIIVTRDTAQIDAQGHRRTRIAGIEDGVISVRVGAFNFIDPPTLIRPAPLFRLPRLRNQRFASAQKVAQDCVHQSLGRRLAQAPGTCTA